MLRRWPKGRSFLTCTRRQAGSYSQAASVGGECCKGKAGVAERDPVPGARAPWQPGRQRLEGEEAAAVMAAALGRVGRQKRFSLGKCSWEA